MRRIAVVLMVILGILATTAPAQAHTRVRPLPNAHAHNDYEHTRPLFDALDNGFTSVEADIFLVDGQLLVGHDPSDLTPTRTLQGLYLDPLRDRVLRNGGTVYPRYHGEFQLLVDVKATGAQTYAALDKVLRSPRYAFLFTHYLYGHVLRGAITVVISGDRDRATMTAQKDRLAFYDGRIVNTSDLTIGSDRRLTPLVSDNWTLLFSWNGTGPIPAGQRTKLRTIVGNAHKAGQQVRFWATPDQAGPARDALCSELVAAGVDYLNTDDLPGLRAFLTA